MRTLQLLRPPTLRLRPVRVSFVIDDLGRAGTETQLLALLQHLKRNEVEPSLVLLDGTGAASRALEPADCPVLRLGVHRLASPSAVAAAFRLRKFWRTHRPDVVQTYFLDASYFAVPLAKLCGVRHVVRVRNNLGYWLTPRHRWLNRQLARMLSASLTNSDAGREALIAADGLPPGRVRVLGNGVDVARFAALEIPTTFLRIGCVANLRPVKNIDGLLRAAKIVCDRVPHVRFEVAGDGEARPTLEALHAELGLGDRFILRGSVADIPAFLGGVDAVALPSHSEGMSNALLEAMAAGRAVIATDVGANASVLGGTGEVVPPGDVLALAEAILRAIANPAASRANALAARRRVEMCYSREAMRRAFTAFYRELCT